MVGTTSDWEDELGRWLEPFLERLGHRTHALQQPIFLFDHPVCAGQHGR